MALCDPKPRYRLGSLILMLIVCTASALLGGMYSQRVTADQYRESLAIQNSALMALTNDALDQSRIENARAAGRLEGLLTLASPEAKTGHWSSQVWHDGYDRGLQQSKDMADLSYNTGYHAALKDSGCPDGTKTKVYSPPKGSQDGAPDVAANQ